MRKNKKAIDLSVLLLFIIYIFLNLWGLGVKELRGDEGSSLIAVIPAMKFYKDLKFLSSIFLFGHSPLRGLIEIPFLYIFGLKEFWLYLPNVLASIGFFVTNFFILKKTAGREAGLIGSVFLAVNGGIVLQRLIMGVGLFLLFSNLLILYFYKFLKNENITDLRLSLLMLFLCFLTYAEGIVFIAPMFYFLYKRNFFTRKGVLQTIIIFFTALFIFVFLWALVPILGAKLDFIGNLKEFGFFRLFYRAKEGFAPNFAYLFNLLKAYNSNPLTVLIILGLLFSVFHKKSNFFWSFLFLPLLYFSIKTIPTVHLYNYLNLIIILASLGWVMFLKLVGKRVKGIKITFYLLLTLVLFVNLKHYKDNFKGKKLGLKSTAYLIREKTGVCEKMYTDIEGHVARIYFGRRYVENKEEADFVVLEKDLKQNKELERKFNKKYSSFKNLMPYLKVCKN